MLKEAKKAQGLSINAIILIVLGILVLVLLIVGFTMGWNRIFPFISPAANVQEVSDQCALKCSMNAKFDFCSLPREINMDRTTAEAVGLDRTITATCADLAQNPTYKSVLGIKDCPGLCDASCKLTDTDPSETTVSYGIICPIEKCAGNVAEGTFRDVNSTSVCCKKECTK